MAEAAFKQMIAALIRQTRPQTFRCGKPPRYPQRSIVTTTAPLPTASDSAEHGQWQSHSIAPVESDALPARSRLHELRTESEPRPFSSFLTDSYAREHNYLRISLTERCNLRCVYCMPEEGIELSPPDHILTTPEIVYLSSLFVDQGVNKIRLTGGEPTVRKDILDLMRQIGGLRSNGLKELCLTTNGISLHRKLDSMVESGLTGVNLSLDTLDPFQFTIMTRRNGHETVMKSINRILDMNKHGAGIKLKINCVVMRGLNDNEIVPFVELGKEKDLEVRFIEYMPFDGNKWSQKKMLGFQEMLALIRQKYPDVYKVQDHVNDTSKTYQIPGFAGRIGFITSMTHNFCGTCNRLRITSDGNLKVCLFGNSEVSLRDILRESNNGNPIDAEAMDAMRQFESDRRQAVPNRTGVVGLSDRDAKLLDVIAAAVKRKKEKHAGMGELENMKNRPMILIDNPLYASANFTTPQSHPSLRPSSPILAARTSTIFTRSIPVHLLSQHPQSSIFQQQRYRSTFLLRRTYITKKRPVRYVWTLGTHRRVESRSSEVLDTRRQIGRVKTLLHEAVWAFSKRSKSRTVSSQAYKDGSAEYKPILSHLTSSGTAHMINVGHKTETQRSATAVAYLEFSEPSTYTALTEAALQKGDAIAVARIAAIQAAKKTADILPLAHPGLRITGVNIDIEPFPAASSQARQTTPEVPSVNDDTSNSETTSASADANTSSTSSIAPLQVRHLESEHGGVCIIATVGCDGKTGVEMEALTAANAGALTMYDMLKGIDKAMVITGSRVIEKRGGKSGSWRWSNEQARNIPFNDSVPNASSETTNEVSQTQRTQHANSTFQPFSTQPETLPSTTTTTEDAFPNLNLAFNPDNDTNTSNPDLDANSVFQVEWEDLSTSFCTAPSISEPSPTTIYDETTTNLPTSRNSNNERNIYRPIPFPRNHKYDPTNPQPHPDLQPTNEKLENVMRNRVPSTGFRAARIERFDEWRKSR